LGGTSRAFGLAALSALLAAMAFPPLAWRALAWCALAPLLVALRDAPLARRIALAGFWTLVFGLGLGFWIPSAFAHYSQQPVIAGWLFLVGVAGVALPFYVAFGAAYPLLRHFRIGPVLVGAAWVAVELGRARLLNGSPIYLGTSPGGSLGYSQAGWPIVLQVASWTGIYGVSLAVAVVNACLAEAWFAWRGPAPRGPMLARALVTGALTTGTVMGWGWLALRDSPPTGSGSVRVLLVQPNLDAEARWGVQGDYRTLESHLRLTRRSLVRADPAIVFWPEAALTFFLEQQPLYRRAIGAVLSEAQVELLAGAPRSEAPLGPPYRNSIYALNSKGEIETRYDKQYLVPFVEYFPIGIDVLRRNFGRIRTFEPGVETGPLPTRAGLAGILICNEAMLPQFAAERVREGAAYLVNPSNDGWIPDVSYLEQQFEMALVRAVEQRRYLVRVSDVGPSAIVDPWGRVEARTLPLVRDTLAGSIRPSSELSVYGRIGDAFGVLCTLVALATVLWELRKRLSARKTRPDGGR